MLSDFRKNIAYWEVPGIDRLFLWKEKNTDNDECAALEERY